jgi:hypothetical protein
METAPARLQFPLANICILFRFEICKRKAIYIISFWQVNLQIDWPILTFGQVKKAGMAKHMDLVQALLSKSRYAG